jgi:carbonic anhydrase/acetyltransferase-like protein (isoleucine patch superfamily)
MVLSGKLHFAVGIQIRLAASLVNENTSVAHDVDIHGITIIFGPCWKCLIGLFQTL